MVAEEEEGVMKSVLVTSVSALAMDMASSDVNEVSDAIFDAGLDGIDDVAPLELVSLFSSCPSP